MSQRVVIVRTLQGKVIRAIIIRVRRITNSLQCVYNSKFDESPKIRLVQALASTMKTNDPCFIHQAIGQCSGDQLKATEMNHLCKHAHEIPSIRAI